MIKTVIFDVGGVLLRTESHESRKSWERKLRLKDWESEYLVFNSEMGKKAQLGDATYEELWDWIQQHLALDTETTKAFEEGFWAGDVLDQKLIKYIRQLQGKYGTAIISNYSSQLRPLLTDTFAIADAFDLIVISCEEKTMKPDAEIYERTLQRLSRQPEETVFIDDFAHNIEAAQKLGIHGIHFKPTTDLPAELAKIGVV